MLKILIADDHELFLDGLRLVLTDLDDETTIDTVHNHKELQEKADGSIAYDLILTDLAMPGLNWQESLRLLKEHYPDKYPETGPMATDLCRFLPQWYTPDGGIFE